MNASFVQSIGVTGCVALVLCIGYGKIVRAREIFFCAHIDIVVRVVIQHGVNACNAGDADRSRRQTDIAVGIVRRIHLQMLVEHSLDGEVTHSKDDGRVTL